MTTSGGEAAGFAVFVGSYVAAGEAGIHRFVLGDRGDVLPAAATRGVANPSYAAVHPSGGYVYAVSETGLASDGVAGAVHAFRFERDGARPLAPLGSRPSGGDHPCHIGIHPDGRWLAVANYSSGSAATFPVEPDGSLGEMTSLVRHTGSGPNPKRQTGPHAHAVVFTPDGGYLLVADLGIDRVGVYAFDAGEGTLTPHNELAADPGAGPRHLAFHPDGRHVFVVNELANTVSWCRWDRDAGRLDRLQTVATLPPGIHDGIAAAIRVSPDGRRVYVSNRGHDSLATLTFDDGSGLEFVSARQCGGAWPRDFALTPDGHHVIVANEHSNEITVLNMTANGEPGEPMARVAVPRPTSFTFAAAPRTPLP